MPPSGVLRPGDDADDERAVPSNAQPTATQPNRNATSTNAPAAQASAPVPRPLLAAGNVRTFTISNGDIVRLRARASAPEGRPVHGADDLRVQERRLASLMTATVDNHQFYEHTVFEYWAARTGLIEAERVLVNRYLDKHHRTLEAGTGAGRILLDLHEHGFGDLHGFDYVQGFIDIAKTRDRSGSIAFTVQNAVSLDYPDAHVDQAIYLQQVLCFIEEPADRFRAMQEASRVLKPGGTALFSFLCYEARMNNALYAAFTRYLGFQRLFRRRDVSLQYQPWLKTVNKLNLGALVDRKPYVYWYRFREALDSLSRAGFVVTWVGSCAQLGADGSAHDWQRLDPTALDGMLYVVCRRT